MKNNKEIKEMAHNYTDTGYLPRALSLSPSLQPDPNLTITQVEDRGKQHLSRHPQSAH